MSASAACILNVAHFVDSPPTYAYHLSSFRELLCNHCCTKHFTASISADPPPPPSSPPPSYDSNVATQGRYSIRTSIGMGSTPPSPPTPGMRARYTTTRSLFFVVGDSSRGGVRDDGGGGGFKRRDVTLATLSLFAPTMTTRHVIGRVSFASSGEGVVAIFILF